MFTRRFVRISGVFVGALALLMVLTTFTGLPAQAALAKASGLRDGQPMSMGYTMRMTTTMPMGKAGMGTMGGAMPMTDTMPMTGAMPMDNGAMEQMMSSMMQMMSNMHKMMGADMNMMSNPMPMTQTMPMAGSMHKGHMMQMMGMMMQMMGQMQSMMDMDMSTLSNTMPMTDMMPMTDTMPMTGTMPMTDMMPMHAKMGQMMGMMKQMMTQMMGSRTQPFDLLFIDSMIMHHQGAIDMAKAAQQKAEHPELKQQADAIITAQAAEIKQMQTWRKTWYPNAAQTSGLAMSMGTMKIADDASKSFDLRFIEAMIPHHEGAIAMAKAAQAQAQHPEIKTLAGKIIAAQQKEIAQMKAWKADWSK